MKLEEYRINNGLTYKSLGEELGMTENKTYRLCTDPTLCVKLQDAVQIVKVTENRVSLEDLLSGDC